MAGAVMFRYRKPSLLAAAKVDELPELDDRSVVAEPTTAPRPVMRSAEMASAPSAGSSNAGTRRDERVRTEPECRGDWAADGISPARAAVRQNSSPRARGACATPTTNRALSLPPGAVFRIRNPATAAKVASGPARHATPAPRALSRRQTVKVHAAPAAAATQM